MNVNRILWYVYFLLSNDSEDGVKLNSSKDT